ncbi:hypothetical protein BGZ95_011607 [Linnemannia exigua]|uniref:Uncharacterized protein n=1 Tax=Linnemannia exigua TaxID=604196 RepID=A0AAD4H531_9FUNG|nr:hypothetical protein BGZ95_011607 [Linnemannia exigua]
MTTLNVTATTPWNQYVCNANNNKCADGFSCHGRFCMPDVNLRGEACVDPKDTVAPFVARVDNNCHGNVCYLKKCTKDQSLCRAGQLDYCMGVKKEEIFCYESMGHGSKPASTSVTPVPVTTGNASSESTSTSNVGAIAGGVSAAVIVVLAAGAFFMIRRRRAAKAAKAAAAAQALPTYASQDEKNAMSQVA